MGSFVKTAQAKTLLHNKFVVVLGGSVQRSMYKDLVRLLQTDRFLTLSQLKSKGEHSFERDLLLEGGRLGLMSNGTDYREVRQYHTEHHLLRFYFITRVFSAYMQSVLDQLRQGLTQGLRPDLVIVSSCVWDMTRYGLNCLDNYRENLHRFFGQMKSVVCHDGLLVWTLAMPLSKQIKGGFLVPEVSHRGPSLCSDIIEANFYSGKLADVYGLDVLDLHFHFRRSLQHRMPDGVHWDAVAHRSISSLLLLHVAQAWGLILRVDSTTSAPPPPAGFAAPVSRRKRRKAKVWRAAPHHPPPLPPLMGQGPGHGPWCPRHRPPGFVHPVAPVFLGAPFCAPRLHFPRSVFRPHPSPHALLLPPCRIMAPPDPWFRRPPPDWGAGWGPVRGGSSGRVRWRRPNNRMHPYYPPAPNNRMHPYYPPPPNDRMHPYYPPAPNDRMHPYYPPAPNVRMHPYYPPAPNNRMHPYYPPAPNNRMHPYYPPAPNDRMHPYYPPAPNDRMHPYYPQRPTTECTRTTPQHPTTECTRTTPQHPSPSCVDGDLHPEETPHML